MNIESSLLTIETSLLVAVLFVFQAFSLKLSLINKSLLLRELSCGMTRLKDSMMGLRPRK